MGGIHEKKLTKKCKICLFKGKYVKITKFKIKLIYLYKDGSTFKYIRA